MSPTPVVLDCDPGHDDAVAMLLAQASPALDLLGITTVAGNQTLRLCTRNALRVCALAGIEDVPVAAGADAPLARPLQVAEHIHGESGLDGADLPEPGSGTVAEDAVSLTARLLRDSPGPVTLIATGPLTNLAWLLRRHPDITDRIREVVLMGGATGRGNTTPYAEFNIHTDPEAAREVWASGLEITMVGLNATHQARFEPWVRDRMLAAGGRVAATLGQLLEFYGGAYRREDGYGAPPVHDPVAVARVIDPSLVRCVKAPVVVETAGEYTAGATVVDFGHRFGLADNTHVAVEVATERFWDLVVDAVASHG